VGDTWITNMRHYLDEQGQLPMLPGPAMNIALYLGSIVEWLTSHPKSERLCRTNVRCRRSPGRVRCIGPIEADFEENGEVIGWRCPFCGDNGYIRGWEGTLWDRGRGNGPVPRQQRQTVGPN